MGTSQELKESGSPWSIVASSGVWHPPAFRGYVDMSRDVELVGHQLCEVAMDSESAAEGPVLFALARGEPIERADGPLPLIGLLRDLIREIPIFYTAIRPPWPSG